MAERLGWSDGLLESGFGSTRAAALLSWEARVARMVSVEGALARAQGRVGLLPGPVADAAAQLCERVQPDPDVLAARSSHGAGPVVALVQMLVEAAPADEAAGLHHGATSQDILDTAIMLQVADALRLLDDELVLVADLCAELADRHRGTVAPGRTLGQQAVPVTMGLRAARWLGTLDRRVEQLRTVRDRAVVLQLGGAAGTLAVYGDRGLELAEALGRELGLPVPDLPWHAERDRIVELSGAVAGVAAVVAKIATDLVLLSSTEVGEVRESEGTGPGSSAMPHKRNPIHAMAARAAARLAEGELGVLAAAGEHEYERAAGAWQAEWVALPSALVRTTGAVERLRAALTDLEVDAERALANLDVGWGLTASEGLATALTGPLGRPAAQRVVAELSREAVVTGRGLGEVASVDARVAEVLTVEQLASALDPLASLQLVGALVDRALATHRRLGGSAP